MSHFALAMQPPPLVRLLQPHQAGAGYDVTLVDRRATTLANEYSDSISVIHRHAAVAEQFETLSEEWRRATRFQSSLMRAAAHPLYREIVQLGDEVIPVLLRALQHSPAPWVVALREITGVDPVAPHDRSSPRTVADAWIRWGRGRGLI